MKKFSFNSIVRKQQSKGAFIEAIWKSWHRHLSISIVIIIGIAKKLFCHQNFFFFFKVEYLCSFLRLVTVSVPLCYKYLVLYKTSIGVLEKSFLNIRKYPSWCLKKTTALKISAYFAYFPAKHPGLSSFQVHL